MLRRMLAAVFLVFIGALPLTVQAHPLGNFTINHLTVITFHKGSVSVRYVLDMAEIPTYQTMRAVSSSGTFDAEQMRSWARSAGERAIGEVTVTVDGKPLALKLEHVDARTRAGAGGLPTLYLIADAQAVMPLSIARGRTFRIADATYRGRLGWHDVIIVPETEPTRQLSSYPSALLGSPRALATVTGRISADGRTYVLSRNDANGDSATEGSGGVVESFARSNQLSDMIAHGTKDWGFVALTFLVAIMLGALHALEPGHGKTLLAISLVGARATVKQATVLATALTIAHTIGVLALGLALNLLKGYFVPEDIYPWITLISGIVIAIIGARALARELRLRLPAAHIHSHPHDHAHSHHHGDTTHHHGEMDDAEHALLHAIPGTAPMRFGPTVLAAMSGGIAPCPAALVVLLAAVALNQVAYGIFVIIAFSLGLACTLTALGIAVVRGAGWLQGRPQFNRFVRYGPLLSGCVIALIGSIMVGQGFVEKGVAASAIVISATVLLAIAGYVLSNQGGHRHIETH